MRFYQSLEFRMPSRRFLVSLLSFFAVLMSLGFLIDVRIRQFVAGYAIANLEEQERDLEAYYQQLRLEHGVLVRPERIQKIARDVLDMKNAHE